MEKHSLTGQLRTSADYDDLVFVLLSGCACPPRTSSKRRFEFEKGAGSPRGVHDFQRLLSRRCVDECVSQGDEPAGRGVGELRGTAVLSEDAGELLGCREFGFEES